MRIARYWLVLSLVVAAAILLLVQPALAGQGVGPARAAALPSIPPVVTSLWGGARHGLALKSDGSVWSWGWNINGQLGDNTTTDRNIPVQVIFVQPALFVPFVLR